MLLEEDVEETNLERTPQHVSVVTTEYIASGLDDFEYSALEAADDTRVGDEEASNITLRDAVVRSLGRLHNPPRTFTCWRIPSMKSVVAIVADDVTAQESLLEIWRDYRIPFKAMIYTGPFLVEGTLFSDDNDPPEFFRQAFRPIEDATITYLPGGGAGVISVKLGLVNVQFIHGYGVEKT